MDNRIFPFTAIVGQDQLKLALLLNVIDPSLGGVLAIGDKGTGKTTLVRSLASLMANQTAFPFVNLPIGASEDSLLGQLNLGKLINEKQEHLQLGLLAKAHQGFLYIDEINLLNDYLMDLLLDASSMGYYFLEREGFSAKLDSQFCLIGSMNPEEGDLRPQLKDRFGLSVFIETPQSLEQRVEVIRRRLAFDHDSIAFKRQYEEKEAGLLKEIRTAKTNLSSIECSSDLFTHCAQLAITHQVEGLRADILLVKAAKAFTALQGRSIVLMEDVQAIQDLVLNHRSKNSNAPNPPKQEEKPKAPEQKEKEPTDSNVSPNQLIESIFPENDLSSIIKKGNISKKGDATNKHLSTKNTGIAAQKIVNKRKTVGQYLATDQFELKQKRQQSKTATQLIFVLDSSGSMLQQQVIAYGKGIIKKWAEQQVGKTWSFSLISLFDGDALLQVENSKDANELLTKIESIQTGGKTNIIAAFKQIKKLTLLNPSTQYQLVLISDGRFQSEAVPSIDRLVIAYRMHCKLLKSIHFIDTEMYIVKVGWGKEFMKQLNGTYETLNTTK